MLEKKNQGFFKIAGVALIFALAGMSTTAVAQNKSDIEKVQSLFETPDASSIVKSHNQRIANIEFEIEQLQNLINSYGSFQGRVDRQFTQENQRKEMKSQLEDRLESYWTILEQLKEVREELVKNKPSFKYQ